MSGTVPRRSRAVTGADRMVLDVTPSLARMVLQQAAHAVEGVAQRHVDVHVLLAFRALAPDGDFTAGHTQIDFHVEWCALVAMCRTTWQPVMRS